MEGAESALVPAMRAGSFSTWGTFVVPALLVLGLVPAAPAQGNGVECDADVRVATDPSNDVDQGVDAAGATVPDSATGFSRIDLRDVCILESAEAVHVIVLVGSTIDSDAQQSYAWTLHFQVDGGADTTREFRHADGSATAVPNGGAESIGAGVQFNLAKEEIPVGANLTGLFLESSGRYASPNTVNVITGTDRAPDAGTLDRTYVVGERAPAGIDTDGDGLDDRDEVANGGNPGVADTDGDGLSDGDEVVVGSNLTVPDTDGDGLTDGEEGHGAATIAGVAVTFVATDPTKADTDGDGLTDLEELSGSLNAAYASNVLGSYLPQIPGSTDPNAADTDADGLTDLEEIEGRATVGGQARSFTPTDPNDPDTDSDGLPDGAEVAGRVTFLEGSKSFPVTDPTNFDTDGDGFEDGIEVQKDTDPTDAASKPTSDAPVDTPFYFLLSAVALVFILLLSAGGILWRWG